jgi:hypothetical protein
LSDDLPRLTIPQILHWADAHRARKRCWPRATSGAVAGGGGLTWRAVNRALREGRGGLPGGDSLARLLARLRDAGRRRRRPALSLKRVLGWARTHRKLTGSWPSASSGEVGGAPGETWNAVNLALAYGARGLKGGTTLAKLLRKRARKGPR